MSHPNVSRKGTLNGAAKLTESRVARIKRQLREGCAQAQLAERHGVSAAAICRIATGKAWAHVPWPQGGGR